jgi:hypothetical protein
MSPDAGAANARPHLRRVVRPDLHHRDRRAAPLRPGPQRRRLHPRRRRRHPRPLGRALRELPRHHQHRHRRRAVADRQAAERDAGAQLRGQSCRRVHHHRRRTHQPPRSCSGPVLRRCERAVPRLPVLPIGARAAVDGDVRSRRRPHDLRFIGRRAVRLLRAGRRALPLLDPGDRLRVVDHHLHIVKGFRPSPILDDTRYVGAGEGSGRPAPAPQ